MSFFTEKENQRHDSAPTPAASPAFIRHRHQDIKTRGSDTHWDSMPRNFEVEPTPSAFAPICPGAPVKVPVSDSLVGYDDNTDEEVEYELDAAEIAFLTKQHLIYSEQYKHLRAVKKVEMLRIKRALQALRRTKSNMSDLEEQIWQLANVLGRTDIESYAGLK